MPENQSLLHHQEPELHPSAAPPPGTTSTASAARPPSKEPNSNDTGLSFVHHPFQFLMVVVVRILMIGSLIAVLVLGITHKAFRFSDRTVFGMHLDVDQQLGLVGLVNKILDILLTVSLENLGNVQVTRWMVGPVDDSTRERRGARLSDLTLSSQLTKPWQAVAGIRTRLSLKPAAGRGVAQASYAIFTLTSSVCVLLLGLAVNTIGVPKERWYSDPRSSASVNHRMMLLHDIDWMNMWDRSWAIVGPGTPSWQAVDGLMTASICTAMTDILPALTDSWTYVHKGWTHLGEIYLNTSVAVDSRVTGSTSRAVAFNTSTVSDTFDDLQLSDVQYMQYAKGFSGNLTLLVPSIVVSCDQLQPVQFNSGTSVFVDTTSRSSTQTSFPLHIAPVVSLNFSGATCQASFERVLFPLQVWIVTNQEERTTVDLSANFYGQNYETQPRALQYGSADTTVTARLANKMSDVAPRLETWANGMNAAELLVTTAANIRKYRADFTSDTQAIAPVLASIIAHVVSIARWNVTYTDDKPITSAPIQWQVFSSGPVQSWQWIAAIVIGLLLFLQLCGLAQTVMYRMMPGPWLDIVGMLIVGNRSPPIDDLHDAIEDTSPTTQAKRLYARWRKPEDGIITDHPKKE